MDRFIHIRPKTSNDNHQLARIFTAALAELCSQDYDSSELRAIAEFNHPVNLGWPCQVVVAECEGMVVGYAARLGSKIVALFVHPAYTRRQIGSTLLVALEERALAQNIRKLSVTSSLTAVQFYRACGFTHKQATHCHYSRPIPAVKLEKRLTSDRPSTRPWRGWLLVILLSSLYLSYRASLKPGQSPTVAPIGQWHCGAIKMPCKGDRQPSSHRF